MEVSAGQDGIQRLLAAEQEAQNIVAKARRAKAERLKQAKAEAEREITTFKGEREAAFKQKVADDTSYSGSNVTRLASEAATSVAEVQKAVAAHKKEVLDILLGYVTTVKFVKD